MLKGYQRADAAGKMTMKVNAAVKIEADAGAAGVGDVLKLKQQYYGPHFEVNAVKLFVDGVIETGTAALLAPYVGSDKSGDLLFTPQQLDDIATAADKAAFRYQFHAIGDRATRVTLDAFQAAQSGKWRA